MNEADLKELITRREYEREQLVLATYDPQNKERLLYLSNRIEILRLELFQLTDAQVDDLIETVTNRIATMRAAQEADDERILYAQSKEEERLAKEWYEENS